jgi:threonine dehydrogenase-like Zn-dependent dehydrogenase
MASVPETQYAVQLVGPDKLILNREKKVIPPGPHQILCRVEAVGLCFSDLKLLKQFSGHVRKSEIVSGIEPQVLDQIPSFVPGQIPTVPGHEAVVRVEAVGPEVENIKAGGRYLVQTDYRWLRTKSANAAFGYNFEGGLQQYVLMDQRVITTPDGESLLIPVSESLSAAAAALIEPWACVEDAYASKERGTLKEAGQTLIVADAEVDDGVLRNLFDSCGKPARVTWVSRKPPPAAAAATQRDSIAELQNRSYDDVIYFGADADTIEQLFAKVAVQGLINIVLCGSKIARPIVTPVGRVHYEGIRVIGTAGCDPAESMQHIPETGEVRPGDTINVIGAAGPMGMMHVIRAVCLGIPDVTVFAGDLDQARLDTLTKVAAPLADKNSVTYRPYDPARKSPSADIDYGIVMVPIPDLVADAVDSAAERAIINIFAGIPVTVSAKLNLDTYIRKHLYFIGTSGSILQDMKTVLAKVESGRLDTNVSVAAVCGMAGAVQGIRAVENRRVAGKIVVYPACQELGFIPLTELSHKIPQVAQCLTHGLWNKTAEQKLLQLCTNH